VKKLFHQLDSDKKGLVKLSDVTQLPHLKNNVLAKLVASHYMKKQEDDDNVTEEECLDLEKFIEFFDVLSPKKNTQAKLEGMCMYVCVHVMVTLNLLWLH